MSPALPTDARALLLDIEGTTTPLSFVHDVLFPHARAHMKEFLRRNQDRSEVRGDLMALRALHALDAAEGLAPPPLSDKPEDEIDSFVAYIEWLMDHDRKATPLKSLQGKIWDEGYRRLALRGQVFSDVPVAFRRWQAQGREVAIFSSGSVLAQRLLFSHSDAGDLSRFVRAWFDTTIGAKKESESYRRIASELGFSPGEIVFVSDSLEELKAAQAAGLQVVLSQRPGNPPAVSHSYPVIHSFDELFPIEESASVGA